MSKAEQPAQWGGHIGPEHARAQSAMDRAAVAPPEPDAAAADLARRLRAAQEGEAASAPDRPAEPGAVPGGDRTPRADTPAPTIVAGDRPQPGDTAPARRWTTDRW